MDNLTYEGRIELRATETETGITGHFAWNTEATDRREAFASMAMESTGKVQLLFGHERNRVLADEPSGTLEVRQDVDGLTFDAKLPPESLMTSWQTDAIRSLRQGLIGGVSPGFRVDDEEHRAGMRLIKKATLLELSLVPRPAYNAPVQLRAEDVEQLAWKVHTR